MGFFRRSADIKWALVLGEWLHRALQLIQRRVCKTGPDLAGVNEPVLVVVADEQGTRLPGALAFAFEPAADHKLLAVVVLHLHPHTAAPSRLVPRLELLSHPPLHAPP